MIFALDKRLKILKSKPGSKLRPIVGGKMKDSMTPQEITMQETLL